IRSTRRSVRSTATYILPPALTGRNCDVTPSFYSADMGALAIILSGFLGLLLGALLVWLRERPRAIELAFASRARDQALSAVTERERLLAERTAEVVELKTAMARSTA